MTTLNRTLAPALKQIDKVEIIQAKSQSLSNGLPLYSINAGSQDLVKIEWIIEAGSKYESNPLTAAAVNHLIKEGTHSRKSAEIAELLDFYGAFLETECNKDNAHLILYCLNKHLAHVLPIVDDLLKNASFPDHEFEVYKQNSKQKLLVNNQKVDVLARNHFNEKLFGGGHAYGRIIQAEDYDRLKISDIQEFYKHYYHPGNYKIILAGLVKNETIDLIENLFGKSKLEKKTSTAPQLVLPKSEARNLLVPKQDAVQSAIRIGRRLFNKTHPDYFGMQVLNTLLGGYFGSRLMNNIREDKGYTYGIGSALVNLQDAGYFFIATEVGVDVCTPAIQEIYSEIKKLREEPVPQEELDLVKNYLQGTFIRSIDGPFALAEKFAAILEFGLDYSFYDKYLKAISSISPDEILRLAQTYLQEEDLIELVVGKK